MKIVGDARRSVPRWKSWVLFGSGNGTASVPYELEVFKRVPHDPFKFTTADENGLQPTKWAKESSPGQSERRRSRSDFWRAMPWVIVYPRLLLLDQARADSPRLIEELSSIAES